MKNDSSLLCLIKRNIGEFRTIDLEWSTNIQYIVPKNAFKINKNTDLERDFSVIL